MSRDPLIWLPPPPWPVKKRPPSKRQKVDCLDCGVDTSFATGIGHYYRATNEVWHQAVPDGRGMLCLDCLEKRLGRLLVRGDFERTPFEIATAMLPPQAFRNGSMRQSEPASKASRCRRNRNGEIRNGGSHDRGMENAAEMNEIDEMFPSIEKTVEACLWKARWKKTFQVKISVSPTSIDEEGSIDKEGEPNADLVVVYGLGKDGVRILDACFCRRRLPTSPSPRTVLLSPSRATLTGLTLSWVRGPGSRSCRVVARPRSSSVRTSRASHHRGERG
jgi:hypothetical protein